MSDDPRPSNDNANAQSDKPQRPEDSNPFISFRRYADEQVSSLLNSVVGLSTAFAKEQQRWADARTSNSQRNEEQGTGSGRQDVWVKEWSNSKREKDADEDGGNKNSDGSSSWVNIWKSDGQEVKPEIIEGEDGSKSYHWSSSWSWPQKGSDKSEEKNSEVDAAQRDALEQARRNAEKEIQELSGLFKSLFGLDDQEESKSSPRGQSLLDWTLPRDDNISPEKRAESRRDMEEGIRRLEDEFFNVRDSFWGLNRNPLTGSHDSSNARDRSHILELLDDAKEQSHPFAGAMVRTWGHPLSHFLDYSNPRTRWILEHPYSPAVLEAEAVQTGVKAPRYADAFEDLMRAERGFGLKKWEWEHGMWPRSYRLLTSVYSKNPKTRDFWRNVEQGGDWYVAERDKDSATMAQSNQPTGELNFPASPLYTMSSTDASRDREARDHMYERFLGSSTADAKAELDMYERFLGGFSSNHPASTNEQSSPPSSATMNKPSSPSIDVSASPILSTVTTTERSVAPDGTVTTKVVFKKRFADGREESSETVNTSRGDGEARSLERNASPEKKRSGWFWSS